jgi:antitoxin HicB
MRRYYSVVLLPEEGQYTAVVPAIPGCVTQGESVADALDAARDLIQLRLAEMVEHNEEVPEEEGPALFCVVDIEDAAVPAR